MKVLPFRIPTVGDASFLVKDEKLEHFYPYLHRHEEIQICWIRKGKGTLIVEADFYPFEKDDVFFIASNAAHIFKKENSELIECLSIFFNPDPRENPLLSLKEMSEFERRLRNVSGCTRLPPRTIDSLKQILETKSILQLGYFIGLLHEIEDKLEVREKSPISHSDKSADRLKIIMDFTLQNLKENIDLHKVAAQINYTPEAFCRFFKKRTQKTFITYLNELRINEASIQLIQRDIAEVSKIAFECGFNNVSHFNRVFKQIRKQSPLQYRQQYLQNLRN